MIIKIMPENEFEKQKIQEVEHTGVKEFFMFGNKKEMDGDVVDFHDWSGSYRYLEGSLYHFLTTVTEEKRLKSRKTNEISLQPQGQIKPPFIKKGQVDGSIEVLDVEEMAKKAQEDNVRPDTIPFPSQISMPVMPNINTEEPKEDPIAEENLEAEDKD